jgi:hypothetical protein
MYQPTTTFRPGRSEALRRAIIASVAVGIFAAACGFARTAGTGPVESETRATQPFTKIEASYGIGVSVRIGPAAAVEVQAQSQGTVEGLTDEALGIELSGGAGLTATGTARQVALQGSGGAVASLQDLAAGTIVVDLSGGATANLNASDEVLGSVSGGARAVVAGPARLNVDSSGGGEVRHE